MFKVIEKATGEILIVYNIRYDKTGFAHFLIYKNNQWLNKSAKLFKPINSDNILINEGDDTQ